MSCKLNKFCVNKHREIITLFYWLAIQYTENA